MLPVAHGREHRHPLVAGVDGCRGGWVVVTVPVARGAATVWAVTSVGPVLDALRYGRLAAMAIDIPIGLPDTGARRCDVEARRLLGRRASSVFPAPARALLDAASYAEALARSRALCGASISRQLFHLLPKVAEVDALVTPADQRQLVEVHPEVSFTVAAGRPMEAPKRTAAGRDERVRVLSPAFPDVAGHLAARPRGVASDDLLDAFAAAWTARRWLDGTSRRLGGDLDARGLRMEIIA